MQSPSQPIGGTAWGGAAVVWSSAFPLGSPFFQRGSAFRFAARGQARHHRRVSQRLRIATRTSPLARWQADRVAHLLRVAGDADLEVELVEVVSLGDRVQDRPLHEIGGQGVFVKEVQATVLDGRADLAVHSAKDLPSGPAPEGLVLACVPERGDCRDALVGCALADLAEGATVATGSVRRRAQLAALRPDLAFADLRGNLQTRLSKIPDGGAIVAAAAALDRLGLADRAAELFDIEQMVPQVGQGALAVECRADDAGVLGRLAAIENPVARREVEAERAFLAGIGSGCDLPVGATATIDNVSDQVVLRAVLASLDGRQVVRGSAAGRDPHQVGRELARQVLYVDGGIELLQ